jgi:hypothetical protein
MASKIKTDVLQALQDWKAGKPVKSLELGHVHRMKDVPGFSPTIDTSEHLHRDQERAHAYVFHIIDAIANLKATIAEHDASDPQHVTYRRPETWEEFESLCDGLEEQFRLEVEGLTAEELDGAEGLAWKALRFGWARAIEGHKDSLYIEVQNPQVQTAT